MIKTWEGFFAQEKEKLYFQNMHAFLHKVYTNNTVFPAYELVFNAFALTPLGRVKVVILGQDPYHQKGQAMGLAFSVPERMPLPPSLRNIYRELANDLGTEVTQSGDLTYLAKQGVLLLNTILTVEENKPLAHDLPFYKTLMLNVMTLLNNQEQPIVFILWGANARFYKKYITNKQHLIIEATHPSPLSANRGGFFHTKPFTRTNTFLKNNKRTPINWLNRSSYE